jgi:hypothetical protein
LELCSISSIEQLDPVVISTWSVPSMSRKKESRLMFFASLSFVSGFSCLTPADRMQFQRTTRAACATDNQRKTTAKPA